MGKCAVCKTITQNIVFDKTVGEEFLCKECQTTKFDRCNTCKEMFFKEDLVNNICENCLEREE